MLEVRVFAVMWWLLHFLFQLPSIINALQNNVCKTTPDYKFIETSKNCWHNPNVLSNLVSLTAFLKFIKYLSYEKFLVKQFFGWFYYRTYCFVTVLKLQIICIPSDEQFFFFKIFEIPGDHYKFNINLQFCAFR